MSHQKTSFMALLTIILTGVMVFGWQVPAASAASIAALTPADLIQAIEDANDEVAYPGPDTIDLAGSVITLVASYADYNGATGLPQITSDITIQNGTIERDAAIAAEFRLLTVGTGGTLTLDSVTVQNGFLPVPPTTSDPIYSGGGIFSQGTLTLSDSLINANTAPVGGGIVSNNGTLTIQRSTIQNNSSSYDSGGLFVADSPLTITDSTFDTNTSDGGGALVIADFDTAVAETATIDNTVFNNNSAEQVGGLAHIGNGLLTLTNSQITNNNATVGDAGGILADGPMTITRTVISGNESQRFGAGLLIKKDVTIRNSQISGNRAGTKGGGLLVSAGTLQLVNTTISGNEAAQGAGVHSGLTGLIDEPITDIQNSIIAGNSTDSVVTERGSVSAAYSLLEGWSVSSPGVINMSAFSLSDVFVAPEPPANAPTTAGDYRLIELSPAIDAGSNTLASAAGTGSIDLAGNPRYVDDSGLSDTGEGTAPIIDMGAYEFQGTTSCTGYTFPYTVTGGASDLINAIRCANNNGTADIIDLNSDTITLTASYTDYSGATALPVITSDITIQNGTIERDTSISQQFRALVVTTTGQLAVESVTFRHFLLNDDFEALYQGGVIRNDGVLTISSSLFEENNGDDGGVIYSENAELTIQNTTFRNNAAEYGGIVYSNTSLFNLSDSLFENNLYDAIGVSNHEGDLTGNPQAYPATISQTVIRSNAGGIYIAGVQLDITDTDILENTRQTIRIGIGSDVRLERLRIQGNSSNDHTISAVSNVTLLNSLITGNQAADRSETIYYNGFNGGSFTLQNTTISGNTAGANSSGLIELWQAASMTVENSLITGNADNAITLFHNSTLNASYSLIDGWTGGGTGNITSGIAPSHIFTAPEPPANAPTATGDYSLTEASPAIDAGSNTLASAAGTGSIDLAGNPRYVDDSGLSDTGEGTTPIIDMGAYEFQGTSCTGYTFPYTVTGGAADLIDAIQCANANSTADIIDLNNATIDAIGTYADYGGDIGLRGLPAITSAITLQNGTIEESYALYVTPAGHLTITSVNFTRSSIYYKFSGGAVYNAGTLDITNSRLDRYRTLNGGAIANVGTLSITDSEFNGNGADADGGAIINLSSTATISLDNVLFQNNNADENGGAIAMYDGSITINSSEFMSNSGNLGGALFTRYGSSGTISASEFSGNRGRYSGGAIASEGTLDITRTRIIANVASALNGNDDADGIYNTGTMSIHNSLLVHNNTDGSGASIYQADSATAPSQSLSLVNVTLDHNRSTDMAAIVNDATASTLTVQNSLVYSNVLPALQNTGGTVSVTYSLVEGWTGGGIGNLPDYPKATTVHDKDYHLQPASPAIDAGSNTAASGASISSTDLAGNPRYADDPGTADRGEGNAPLIDIGAQEFQGTSCGSYTFPYTVTGGASDLIEAIRCANANATADIIDLNNSILTLTDSFSDIAGLVGLPGIHSDITLQNGTLERDTTSSELFGLIYVGETGALTVENVTLRNGGDPTDSTGGAIHALGTLTVQNSTFQNNQAVTGGAIQSVFAPLMIHNSTFQNNQASIFGGAIFAGGDNVLIEDSTFSQNIAEGPGGAIFLNDQFDVEDTIATVHSSTFSGNQGDRGGAIDVEGATLTVEDSVFDSNQAIRSGGESGGAISVTPATANSQTYTGTLTVHRSLLRGNQATTSGGAIHTDIPTTITQSLFSGNTASTSGGALHSSTDITLTNSTLSGNQATDGGALYSQSGTLTATNNIIWNNSPATPVVLNPASASVDYNLIEGWSGGGTGNIVTGYTAASIFTAPVDPTGTPTTAGDYSLAEASPAIDAASNTAASNASIGSTDLAGNPRYTDDPGTADTGEGNAPLIDMGAQEFQGTSPAGVDVDNDGIVSPTDAIYVINRLGSTDPSADVDGDGDVDTDDVTAIQNELGNPAP